MSVPTFGDPDATTEGDQYTVRENAGHVLIVKPRSFNPSVPTKNTPEGTPCVRVDLVDLDDSTGQFVYRNVPLFGGSLVDSTRNHIDAGTVLLVRVRLQPNRGGNREYPVFDKASGDPAAVSRAGQFYAAKGDPFAPQFADPTPPAPPAGSDPWNSAGGAPY